MSNNKYFNIFWVLMLFLSCSDNDTKKEYFSNGNVKLIYNIDSNNKRNGQFKEYYKNGNLYSEGTIFNDTIKIGKWLFYDINGNKKSVIEYFDIRQQSYVNQKWIFNQKGDTVGGIYYKMKMKDTISIGENLMISIALSRYSISNDSKLFLCIPKSRYKLKKDFSNEDSIKFDTILNMESLLKDNPKYKGWNHDIVFELAPSTTGKKNIRGFLLEKKEVESDSIDFFAGKIYFDWNFYAK